MKKSLDNAKKYISENWVYLLIILLFILFKGWKWFKAKPRDEKTQADEIISKLGVSKSDTFPYNAIALDIAHNLGTAYSMFDPRSWTENDNKVYLAVKDLNRKQFDVIAQLYFQLYAKGHTLSSDLASMLDGKLYAKLTIK